MTGTVQVLRNGPGLEFSCPFSIFQSESQFIGNAAGLPPLRHSGEHRDPQTDFLLVHFLCVESSWIPLPRKGRNDGKDAIWSL